jgi:hypothetical protein
MNENEIILFAREEADQIAGRLLDDEEWDKIREWITTDDNMWEVIEQCIKATVEEVVL